MYREAPTPLPPVKPLNLLQKLSPGAVEEHRRAEQEVTRSLEENLKILQRDDIRMTLVPGKWGIPSFVTLVPLDDSGH